MFIRWKRRKKAVTKPGRRPRRRSQSGDSLYCVVVESLRVGGGPPRQKVICYLGSVDDGNREKLWARVEFWDGVLLKLDQLRLGSAERSKIEASIEKIIARVPEGEAAAYRARREAYRVELMRRIEVLRGLGLL